MSKRNKTVTGSKAGSEGTAPDFMIASVPRSADIHLFDSDDGHQLFVANGSRLFDISDDLFAELGSAISTDRVDEVLARVGAGGPRLVDDRRLEPLPIHAFRLPLLRNAISAAPIATRNRVSSAAQPRTWRLITANRAVDLLLSQAGDGGNANLAFLGGEPLVNQGRHSRGDGARGRTGEAPQRRR